MDPAPIFIWGADRSGIALLRHYLDAGSTLAVPSESWFLIDLLDAFDPERPLDRHELERAVALVTSHPRWTRGWRLDAERLRSLLTGIETLPLAHFVDLLYRLELDLDACGRWGDKTPGYVFHSERLARLFPDARFVHVVRDGRDLCRSLSSRRRQTGALTPYQIGSYWARYVRAADDAARRLGPGRVHEVRYEALVADPQATLERLCRALDLPLWPERLSPAPAPMETNGSLGWRPPRTLLVGMAAGVMVEELRAHGYPEPPSATEAALLRQLALADQFLVRQVRPRYRQLQRRLRRAVGTVLQRSG